MASSKTARRKRRQAAALRRYKRLRRQRRLPVHTRTERKRAAEERQRWRKAERKKSRRIREVATIAATSAAAGAVVTFVPRAHIPLNEIFKLPVAAEAASWRDFSLDKSDSPHTELLEVVQPDPFIPIIGTASIHPGYGRYPSGGVNPHPDGWEQNHWLMHDD